MRTPKKEKKIQGLLSVIIAILTHGWFPQCKNTIDAIIEI